MSCSVVVKTLLSTNSLLLKRVKLILWSHYKDFQRTALLINAAFASSQFFFLAFWKLSNENTLKHYGNACPILE